MSAWIWTYIDWGKQNCLTDIVWLCGAFYSKLYRAMKFNLTSHWNEKDIACVGEGWQMLTRGQGEVTMQFRYDSLLSTHASGDKMEENGINNSQGMLLSVVLWTTNEDWENKKTGAFGTTLRHVLIWEGKLAIVRFRLVDIDHGRFASVHLVDATFLACFSLYFEIAKVSRLNGRLRFFLPHKQAFHSSTMMLIFWGNLWMHIEEDRL